jgi:putative FmdB family regulatory protein
MEVPMPHYVFLCEACQKEFTVVIHIAELETAPVKCPECGSEKVHQGVAAFSAVTSKKN